MLSLAVWAQDMFSISVRTWDWDWDPFSHCVPLSDCLHRTRLCFYAMCSCQHPQTTQKELTDLNDTGFRWRLHKSVKRSGWISECLLCWLWKMAQNMWPALAVNNHSLHCNKVHRSMKSSILLAKTVTSMTESMNECDSWCNTMTLCPV